MKIYTKTGDQGETSLFGGQRVWKDDSRIQAYGTIDELNSVIGIAISELKDEELINLLRCIQNELFTLGSDLAAPREKQKNELQIERVNENFWKRLENHIDKFSDEVPELKNFILPGGTKAASFLHKARTVCRRAEREVVALSKNVEIGQHIVVYLNRLSDLLFVISRVVNHRSGINDILWQK